MTYIDFEKADKKMSNLEQYWLEKDLSNLRVKQEVGQEFAEVRKRAIGSLVDKIPEDELLRESIEKFRKGEEIDNEVEILTEECQEMIELAKRHMSIFAVMTNVAGVPSIYPIIKNQVDPSSILIHLQCYRPDTYQILLNEVGGFEYVKYLTVRVWSELREDVEQLDNHLQKAQGQPNQGGY